METTIPKECTTVPQLFWHRVALWSENTALRAKKYGIWQEISWREYGQKARYVALGLIALGLEKGDRVAIICENRSEWLFCDMGILSAGGVTVGIYTTDTTNQVEYLINNCSAKFFIAEDEEQLDKILEIRNNISSLEKFIIIDMEGLRDFSDSMAMSFDELLELGKQNKENRIIN